MDAAGGFAAVPARELAGGREAEPRGDAAGAVVAGAAPSGAMGIKAAAGGVSAWGTEDTAGAAGADGGDNAAAAAGASAVEGRSRPGRRPSWINFVNLVAYVANLVVTALAGFGVFGRTNVELSRKYPTLITPAGWAFSIWGLIFLWEAVFTGAQLLPRFRGAEVVVATAPWWWLTCAFQVAWSPIFSQDLIPASLAMMLGLLVSLLALAAAARRRPPKGQAEFWLLLAPFSLHLGWIILASALNASVFADWQRAKPEALLALAVISFAAVLAFSVGFALAGRCPHFLVCLVAAWGLAGVSAELGHPARLNSPDRFNPYIWDPVTLRGLRLAALVLSIASVVLAVVAAARSVALARRPRGGAGGEAAMEMAGIGEDRAPAAAASSAEVEDIEAVRPGTEVQVQEQERQEQPEAEDGAGVAGHGVAKSPISPTNWLNLVFYGGSLLVTVLANSGLYDKKPGTISSKYQTLATPAGWAFFAWVPIFMWEGVFVVAQLLPRFRDSPVVNAVSPWWWLAASLQVCWSPSFAQELLPLSFMLMLGILVSLLALVKIAAEHTRICSVEFWLLLAPFSLHLGWVIAMTEFNINILADSERASPDVLLAVAILSFAAVFGFAVALTCVGRTAHFLVCLVAAWTYFSIYSELLTPTKLDSPGRFNPHLWDLTTIRGLRTAALGLCFASLALAFVACVRSCAGAVRQRRSDRRSHSRHQISGREHDEGGARDVARAF